MERCKVQRVIYFAEQNIILFYLLFIVWFNGWHNEYEIGCTFGLLLSLII